MELPFKNIFNSEKTTDTKELYYLKPDFKYSDGFIFIIMLIPMVLIFLYNSIDNKERFTNKHLEKYTNKTQETTVSNDIDYEEWDVIEYIKDKFEKIKKYILTNQIIKDVNGTKTINIRYKI